MQSAECRVQNYGRFSLSAKMHNYLNCVYLQGEFILILMQKTDEGGFPPQLCTLNSALCTNL